MKIKIKKIKKDNIFTNEFLALNSNNEIDLSSKSICVLYGPNGTGKTSLSKILSREKSTEYTIKIDETTYTEQDEPIAHIISDQNDRNLIQGETQDFILGDHIKREYELKERINNNFKQLFEKDIVQMLKSKYGISTKNSQFDSIVLDKTYLKFISDIANKNSKGKLIDREEFINTVYGEGEFEEIDSDKNKFDYFVKDFGDKDSTIRAIISYTFNLTDKDKKIAKLEEQNQAVNILRKYTYLEECLVCDNHIDSMKLLEEKNDKFNVTQNSLSEEEKVIAEKIIKGLPQNDPFNIRDRVFTAISKSDKTFIEDLVSDFEKYKKNYWLSLKKDIVELALKYNLKNDNDEYITLMHNKRRFSR